VGGLKASARTVDCSEWSASATNPRVTLPSGQIRDVFPQIGWQGLNVWFVDDSPLEGDGFEPSVPGRETVNPIVGGGTACSKTGADLSFNDAELA